MAGSKPHYIAKVTPSTEGGFLGEVVAEDTGAPAGFSSRTATAEDAAADAIYGAEALNEHDVRYDG